MDRAAIEAALAETFDEVLERHGFADHFRDYEVVVSFPSVARPGEPRRYVFRHCVEAHVETALRGETWRRSLDDRLLAADAEPDGTMRAWSRWQDLYPGATLVADSARARHWADLVGIPFHEVRIESNVQTITLVFSDLVVTPEP